MGQWRFDTVANLGQPFVSGHDQLLLVASVLIAILAASVLIPSVERFRASRTLSGHLLWTLTGALAMAFGVWGMHFCALLALELPVAITFNPTLTAVSIVPAIVGAAITIGICKAPIPPPVRVYIAAIAMSVGFCAVYYISMEAMVGPLYVRYDFALFVLSFVATAILLWGGLLSNIVMALRTVNHWSARAMGSAILGIAVSATHFFAALATRFYPNPSFDVPIHEFDGRIITLGIVIVVSILVGLLLMAIFIDRRISTISRSLNNSELRFQTLAETSACAIFTFGKTFTYANPALSDITGYTNQELRQMSVEAVFGNSISRNYDKAGAPISSETVSIEREVEIECRDGTSRWVYLTIGGVAIGGDMHYVGSAFDITERKNMERRLRHLAFYDNLTDLPNRLMFVDNLQKRLDTGVASDNDSCALLTVNLGRLKWINDNFGQVAGDELLRVISRGLRDLAGRTDMLARVGGHEFALLLHQGATADDAMTMAETILRMFAKPYCVSEQEIQLRCQIGIALATPTTTEAEYLLRQAYIAMNHARGQPTNSFCMFDHAMRESAQQRLQLESDLNRALVEQQFELYYQPIVSLPSGDHIHGFEALIRWRRADGSFTSPAVFIPVAEETGLIAPLGDWILQTACRQLELWNQRLDDSVYISVNISSLQLFQPNFTKKLAKLLKQHKIRTGQLKLELTESVLVEDGPSVLRTMRELLALGCEIMIDDFGTGYSSLSYLSRFPASVLKIDQSFIQSIGPDDVGAPIIKAIVSMARDLGLGVVAEGIENEHAARLLKAIGCDTAQGYLFSRPVPSQEATRMLLDSRGELFMKHPEQGQL